MIRKFAPARFRQNLSLEEALRARTELKTPARENGVPKGIPPKGNAAPIDFRTILTGHRGRGGLQLSAEFCNSETEDAFSS